MKLSQQRSPPGPSGPCFLSRPWGCFSPPVHPSILTILPRPHPHGKGSGCHVPLSTVFIFCLDTGGFDMQLSKPQPQLLLPLIRRAIKRMGFCGQLHT